MKVMDILFFRGFPWPIVQNIRSSSSKHVFQLTVVRCKAFLLRPQGFILSFKKIFICMQVQFFGKLVYNIFIVHFRIWI